MFDKSSVHATLSNLLFSVVPILGVIALVGLASQIFLPFTLGIFLMMRQFTSTVSNILHLGTPETILFYNSKYYDNDQMKLSYIVVSLTIVCAIVFVGVLIAALFSAPIGAFLFPASESSDKLFTAFLFMCFSQIIFYIMHNALLAEKKFILGNITELMTNSLFFILLIIYLPQPGNISLLVTVQSWLVIAMSAFILASLLLHYWRAVSFKTTLFEGGNFKRIMKSYVAYGVPRGISKFLSLFIISIGPWILREDPVQAGYLMLALLGIKATQAALTPMSQVMSVFTPRIEDDDSKQQRGILHFVEFIFYSSGFVISTTYIFGVDIYVLWLGDITQATDVYNYFKYLVFAVLPFALFAGLRGFITVKWHKPYNLYILFYAACAFFITHMLFPGNGAICAAMLMMSFMLGAGCLWLTRYYVRALLNFRTAVSYSALMMGFTGAMFFIKKLGFHFNLFIAVILLGFALLLTLCYFVMYKNYTNFQGAWQKARSEGVA